MFGEVRRGSAMLSDIIRCSAILSELQFTIVTLRQWIASDLQYLTHMLSSKSPSLDRIHRDIAFPLLTFALSPSSPTSSL